MKSLNPASCKALKAAAAPGSGARSSGCERYPFSSISVPSRSRKTARHEFKSVLKAIRARVSNGKMTAESPPRLPRCGGDGFLFLPGQFQPFEVFGQELGHFFEFFHVLGLDVHQSLVGLQTLPRDVRTRRARGLLQRLKIVGLRGAARGD